MRRIMMLAGITAALGAAAPASAQWAQFHEWDFCTANALSVCMNFTLNRDGTTDNYRLKVTYVSTDAAAGQQGAMTAAGLYTAKNAAALNVSSLAFVAISPNTASWNIPGTGNQLSGGSAIAIMADGNAQQGITNGLPVAGWVELSFTSSNLASYNMTGLHARSHIQGFGPNGCSLKPDSNLPGNLVDPVSDVDERCGLPTEVVPEPITMILLGSGLLGVGGAQARRRRRNGLDAQV